MLYFNRARLALLSQPKTGTTALVKSLSELSSFACNNPPRLKHVGYREFVTHVSPLIEHFTGHGRNSYQVASVMRDPLDWFGSWYRYRSREDLAQKKSERKAERYTGALSFDEFLVLACKREKGERSQAQVGSPCSVALDRNNKIGVDRIFPYEDLSGLLEYLEDRMQAKIELKEANVSPPREMTVSPEVEAMVRQVYKAEFDLHASLKRDGSLDKSLLDKEMRHDYIS